MQSRCHLPRILVWESRMGRHKAFLYLAGGQESYTGSSKTRLRLALAPTHHSWIKTENMGLTFQQTPRRWRLGTNGGSILPYKEVTSG